MTNATRLVIYNDTNGQYRWHAQAGNGEIIAQGEAHTRREDATRAATAAFPDVDVTQRFEDPEAGGA
jgi:uncharacterized protein YegP (UPF0339 family)